MSGNAIASIPLKGGIDAMPAIGFGTWRYRGGAGVLVRATELGCGFIDTAESYGNEDLVGTELAPVRDRVFLATKVSPENLRLADVIRHCLRSIERLGVSAIDLYQVHWPNPHIPINETMRGMRHLVEEGLVRYVGVSNFSIDQMQAAQAALGDIPLVSNQIRYNLVDRQMERDTVAWCRDNGVLVIAYRPLARFELGASKPVVESIAEEVGRSPAQVLLNWAIGDGGVTAIPKTDRIERVDDLAAATRWRLTGRQRRLLEAGTA
ncbi:MAG: aldo/keto reductase [Chloroflexi bacterium]|nr:aldo/keto reductase [Chloroflexota bacterium]